MSFLFYVVLSYFANLSAIRFMIKNKVGLTSWSKLSDTQVGVYFLISPISVFMSTVSISIDLVPKVASGAEFTVESFCEYFDNSISKLGRMVCNAPKEKPSKPEKTKPGV